MDRNDIAWTGYIPAITTPFTREGNLDWPALAQQLEWYVQERMHGVILAGTSGEWFSLNEAERAQLFAESGRNIGGRITVLGGCNAYTAAEAIRHARAAQRAGLDGIILTPPLTSCPATGNWFSSTRTSPTRRTSPSASTTGRAAAWWTWTWSCWRNCPTSTMSSPSRIPRRTSACSCKAHIGCATGPLLQHAHLGAGRRSGGVGRRRRPDGRRRRAGRRSSGLLAPDRRRRQGRRGHAGRARPGHHESLVQQGLRRQLRQRPGHPQDSAAPARRSGRPCTASAAGLERG